MEQTPHVTRPGNEHVLCDHNDEMYQWMMRAKLYKTGEGGERYSSEY